MTAEEFKQKYPQPIFHVVMDRNKYGLSTTDVLMQDMAEEYAIVSEPEANGGIIIYGMYNGVWASNPFSLRFLVRELLERIKIQAEPMPHQRVKLNIDYAIAEFKSLANEYPKMNTSDVIRLLESWQNKLNSNEEDNPAIMDPKASLVCPTDYIVVCNNERQFREVCRTLDILKHAENYIPEYNRVVYNPNSSSGVKYASITGEQSREKKYWSFPLLSFAEWKLMAGEIVEIKKSN
jgi:hypothetical protein